MYVSAKHRIAILTVVVVLFGGWSLAAAQVVAQYSLSAGWGTFGLALPQGAARGGVTVGSQPTQTDVKVRWPDGSIRFAVVTTHVDTPGVYNVSVAGASAGAFQAAVLRAAVRLRINGQVWTAAVSGPSADTWLAGPLVRESRYWLAPALGATPHPFLRVILDVRSFVDGSHRLDVTVENSIDVQGAKRVAYDVSVEVGGTSVFSRSAVSHGYLARWRRTFGIGHQAAAVKPDFRPFAASQAVPTYSPSVVGDPRSIAGNQFDILGTGGLRVPMDDVGGREEIAPYPDWTAEYLVHGRQDQQDYVVRHGELAGSFAVHLREPDGSLINIDRRPNFWLDPRADAGDRPLGDLGSRAPLADNAHQPSLALVPYLITGDRYFADEMAFWANFTMLNTFQDRYYNGRQGARGLLGPANQPRGIGWGLRNLADAAALLPDGFPYKNYFAQKVRNNLVWLDQYATKTPAPLGTLFPDRRPENDTNGPQVWIALWEHEHLAWAIDRANRVGFAGGNLVSNRIAQFQIMLLTSGAAGYSPAYGGPYVLAVGTRNGDAIQYYSTPRQLFDANYRTNGQARPAGQLTGYYGVQAWVAVRIGVQQGLPGSREADAYLQSYAYGSRSLLSDIWNRAGWAIVDSAGVVPVQSCARPGQPGKPVASVSGQNVTLSWTPAASNCGVQQYLLGIGSRPGLLDLGVVKVGSGASFTTQAPPGTFFVKVAGSNAAGIGAPSAETAVSVSGAKCTAPAQTFNLSARMQGRVVTLDWFPHNVAAVLAEDQRQSLQFVVEAGSASGRADIGTWRLGRVLSFSVPAPRGTYFVRVRPANGCGAGGASNEVRVVVS